MIGLLERCNQKTPEGGNDDATNCSSLNDAACPLHGHAGCRSGQAWQPHAAQRPDFARGTETKRGIDLALEELGNKLGGLPVKYTVVDDKTNPAEAVQGASKLIDDAKVDFVTGLGASNTLIPVFKTFVDAGIFAVGALAGPLQFAGKECHPN